MWPFRRRSDEDFRREIEAHIAIEAERLAGDGMSRDEARHTAARRFGNVTAVRERFYERRPLLWIDEARRDAAYACRALRRSPGFAAVAIMTLALGIGANTAIFTVVDAVLLRPLPYRDPGSLVLIETSPLVLAAPWLTDAWREHARTIDGFAGFNGPRSATLIAGGRPASIDSAMVTHNALRFLGVTPLIGRDFTADDGLEGAAPVAILAHDLWATHYGSDPEVLGTPISLGGDTATIVGVAPRSFRFPAAGALPANAMPVDTQPDVLLVASPSTPLNVIARLAPGVTPQLARDELLRIFKQTAQARFAPSLLDRLELETGLLQERLAGNITRRLWLALGAVGFVLLVACANVASLLLARASTRQRELTVRTALGARRSRLARLLLTESLVLALLGSAGGLALAAATSGVARTLLADRLPHLDVISPDWRILAFTAAVAAATGILCGLASIPGATRVHAATLLNGAGSPAVSGRTAVRRALLSTEVAVTFVLVVGAALLAQTLWNLSAKDRGFESRQVLTVRVTAPLPPHVDPSSPGAGQRFFGDFFSTLAARMTTIAGVTSAAAVSSVPFTGLGPGLGNIRVEGQTVRVDEAFTAVAAVTPGYFRTMRIPLVAGRDFDGRDRLGSDKVAIVNTAFQRRYAPAGDVVGSRIRTSSGSRRGSGEDAMTIVGIVGNVPDSSLRDDPEPMVFLAVPQMAMHPFGWGQLRLVLRTAQGDPRALAPAIRREIWSMSPALVIDELATMDERVEATLRAERDSALLFGLFAAAALVLSAIGVYGVAAYSIAQRTKEIGIRIALGAARADVARMVVSHTLWPTLAGIAIGVAAAAMLTRLVASMVYGVTPLDPATFAGGVALLIGVALTATWFPARRATRVDPLSALRYE